MFFTIKIAFGFYCRVLYEVESGDNEADEVDSCEEIEIT
jgi:hypothetical protein